jgi:hypothetical protein
MIQVPVDRNVAIAFATVQIDGVRVVTATESPDVAVAATAYGLRTVDGLGGEDLKAMVCDSGTSGAAAGGVASP